MPDDPYAWPYPFPRPERWSDVGPDGGEICEPAFTIANYGGTHSWTLEPIPRWRRILRWPQRQVRVIVKAARR